MLAELAAEIVGGRRVYLLKLKHWVFHQCVHWWNPGVLKNEHDVVTSCHWSIDQWFLTRNKKITLIKAPN